MITGHGKALSRHQHPGVPAMHHRVVTHSCCNTATARHLAASGNAIEVLSESIVTCTLSARVVLLENTHVRCNLELCVQQWRDFDGLVNNESQADIRAQSCEWWSKPLVFAPCPCAPRLRHAWLRQLPSAAASCAPLTLPVTAAQLAHGALISHSHALS